MRSEDLSSSSARRRGGPRADPRRAARGKAVPDLKAELANHEAIRPRYEAPRRLPEAPRPARRAARDGAQLAGEEGESGEAGPPARRGARARAGRRPRPLARRVPAAPRARRFRQAAGHPRGRDRGRGEAHERDPGGARPRAQASTPRRSPCSRGDGQPGDFLLPWSCRPCPRARARRRTAPCA